MRFFRLGQYPEVGRARDDLRPGLPSYPVGEYIIIYAIEGPDAVILHVFPGRRTSATLMLPLQSLELVQNGGYRRGYRGREGFASAPPHSRAGDFRGSTHWLSRCARTDPLSIGHNSPGWYRTSTVTRRKLRLEIGDIQFSHCIGAPQMRVARGWAPCNPCPLGPLPVKNSEMERCARLTRPLLWRKSRRGGCHVRTGGATMDLTFSADEVSFREEVRGFVREHLPAAIRDKLASGRHPGKDDIVAWTRILAAKGWSVPHWPVEWGRGYGLEPDQAADLQRRNSAWACPGVARLRHQHGWPCYLHVRLAGPEGAVPAAHRGFERLVVPRVFPSRAPGRTSRAFEPAPGARASNG